MLIAGEQHLHRTPPSARRRPHPGADQATTRPGRLDQRGRTRRLKEQVSARERVLEPYRVDWFAVGALAVPDFVAGVARILQDRGHGPQRPGFVGAVAVAGGFAARLNLSPFELPPPFAQMISGLQRTDEVLLPRLLFGNVRELLEEWFETEQIRGLVGSATAAAGMMSPSTTGSLMQLVMRPLTDDLLGPVVVERPVVVELSYILERSARCGVAHVSTRARASRSAARSTVSVASVSTTTLLPFAGAGRQVDDDANPLLAGLDPEHGRRLAALPCDLVWATTWMAETNEVLAPRLGTPPGPR
jgi:hypothetical protein